MTMLIVLRGGPSDGKLTEAPYDAPSIREACDPHGFYRDSGEFDPASCRRIFNHRPRRLKEGWVELKEGADYRREDDWRLYLKDGNPQQWMLSSGDGRIVARYERAITDPIDEIQELADGFIAGLDREHVEKSLAFFGVAK